MERGDGRSAGQIRTVRCERGLLSRADGSAQWTQGGTSCLASVTGPTQSYASSKEHAERATVDVIFKSRSGLTGTLERQYEALIRRTCEAIIVAALHPRTLIQVVVQVVSEDGGVPACALNAACAALVDAAVPLRTLCAAVSVALAPAGGAEEGGGGGMGGGGLLMDPSAGEEAAAAALGTFAYLPLLGCTHGGSGGDQADGGSSAGTASGAAEVRLLTSATRGRVTPHQLLDLIEAGKHGADRLAAFMQQAARQG